MVSLVTVTDPAIFAVPLTVAAEAEVTDRIEPTASSPNKESYPKGIQISSSIYEQAAFEFLRLRPALLCIRNDLQRFATELS
jgi:hypothetical protein